MADKFVDNIAELGSEEEDEDYDEETGEARRSKPSRANGELDDSSEEEDEDDEEEERRVFPRFAYQLLTYF